MGHHSKRVSGRTMYRAGPVSCTYGELLRKPGVALDWGWGSSMTGCL